MKSQDQKTQGHTKQNKRPDQQKKPSETNNNVVNMVKGQKIDYDMDSINDFLDLVFHAPLVEGESIISWANATNRPGYPVDIDSTLDKLEKTGLAKACYFGTSTVVPDADGKLYNRKSQFKRLHVVVLDDIGTKIPVDKLPKELVPNYIIESSPGNFQYGFVLDEPIADYDLAEALIHLVYTSGYSDTGGKMPTKVVRLPCGINGKEGEKGGFQVRLCYTNAEYWNPDDLLDVLDVGVSWRDVLKDINVAKQGKSSQFSGTSLWSPIRPTAASLNGVIDPVLEWLYENDMVVSDHGDWVTIVCPWHDGHSGGKGLKDITAGYSPVGRGGENSNRRGFHCFHDHCSENHTSEFLKEIAIRSGIHAPVVDNVADLVADYAFVGADNSAYRIRGVNKPVPLRMDAFKNMHNKKVAVYDYKGKEKLVAESALWLGSANRLSLQGVICDPSSPERIVTHDGLNYLNTYAAPQWGKGVYDQKDIDTFKKFMRYLIPRPEQLSYFLQWLAAKAQNATFKGAAILMVAPTQGTGRTTLTDMIATLFTRENVRKVTFSQLVGATESGAFNDFLEAGVVTCDEIMSRNLSKHKVYESLKDLFDPRPKSMVINTKYGAQRSATVYTSYLLLTNHTDAIGALSGDRRVYVIENTIQPNTPEYFTDLNKWLSIQDVNGAPKWAVSVWRWLHTLEPDLEMLHAPAPETEIKARMIEETSSILDHTYAVMDQLFEGLVPLAQIKDLAISLLDKNLEPDAPVKAEVIARMFRSQSAPSELRARLNGKQVRLRLTNNFRRGLMVAGEPALSEKEMNALMTAKVDTLQKLFAEGDDAIVNKLIDMLDERMA